MPSIDTYINQLEYRVLFQETDQLEIKINSLSKYNETVPAGKQTAVIIRLTERTPEYVP